MKKYWAEAIGTFALVFAGTGAIVIDEVSCGSVTHVGVALPFGLVAAAMIYAVGDVSGAHLKAAVTFGVLLSKRPSRKEGLPCVVRQLVWAFVGSTAVLFMFHGSSLGADHPAGPELQGLVLEGICTAI